MIAEAVSTQIQAIPDIVLNICEFLLCIAVGFIIGKIIGKVGNKLLIKFKVDNYLQEKKGIGAKPSSVADVVLRWIIYLIAIQLGVSFLGIEQLAIYVGKVIGFIVGLAEGVVVIVVAYAIGSYFKDKVITSKTVYNDIIGKVVLFFAVFLGIALGLPFVFPEEISALVGKILLIIIGSVGLGIAIAVGLGLKEPISKIASSYAKDWEKKK